MGHVNPNHSSLSPAALRSVARAFIKPGPSDDETAVLPREGVLCHIRLENLFETYLSCLMNNDTGLRVDVTCFGVLHQL